MSIIRDSFFFVKACEIERSIEIKFGLAVVSFSSINYYRMFLFGYYLH